MSVASSTTRPSVKALVRDWIVQTLLFVVVAQVVVYTVPLLDADTLDWFGSTAFLVPYVLMTVVAAYDGLRTLPDRAERRFWSWIGLGCIVWLVTVTAVSAERLRSWSITHDVASDAAYMFFYVPILMAIELRPHVTGFEDRFGLERNLRWLGLAALVLGWFAYFVLVPLLLEPDFYQTTLTSSLFFITLDVVMLLRFAMLAWSAGRSRWRTLYTALAGASAALLICDTLDVLAAARLLVFRNGRLTDLLWVVAPAAFILTFRLSRVPSPAGAPTSVMSPKQMRSFDPVRVGSLLVAGAFTFPIGHFPLHLAMGYAAPMEMALHSVALIDMTILLGLAVIAYLRVERQRAQHDRDRAALEERLRQVHKLEAVGRVTGAVSDELGRALRDLSLHVERAVDALGVAHPLAGDLIEAQIAARRASGFTRDLFVVSRRLPVSPRPLSLNAAVRDAEPAIRDTAGPRVAVELRFAPDAGHVLMALDAFQTVLTTLVTNARDAMPEGGTLVIETGRSLMAPDEAFAQALRPGHYGRLRVTDSGGGIPAHVMGHLFEPFFTTKDRSGAFGLGLAMTYSLVTQHSGQITVSSEPGHGAQFEILLPAVDPPADGTDGRN